MFRAEEELISGLLSNSIFKIPINQRKYVWDKSQWEDLYHDVRQAREKNEPHFLGSFVIKKEETLSPLTKYTIIDGQQRLTTITLFLAALLLHFHERGLTDYVSGGQIFLRPKDIQNKQHLVLQNAYHQGYENLIEAVTSGPAFPTIEGLLLTNLPREEDQGIKRCFRYFYDEIASLCTDQDSPQILSGLMTTIIGMKCIRIIADKQEDAYTIFEILNARGQHLAPHELLKNFLIRNAADEEERKEVKSRWDYIEMNLRVDFKQFVRQYAAHRYGKIAAKKKEPMTEYETITHFLKDGLRNRDRAESVFKFLKDLELKASYYHRIAQPDDPALKGVESEVFTVLKEYKLYQIRPVLLSLIHQKELGKLSETVYHESIVFIMNFLICYIIMGRSHSNTLTGLVVKYAPRLGSEQFEQHMLDEFLAALKGKIPNEQWFLKIFRTIGYSKTGAQADEREKERAQLVILTYERHLRRIHKVPGIVHKSQMTLEHILPDASSVANAIIGNLLPLENHLNQNADAKEFHEKVKIYQKSAFVTVEHFLKRYSNGFASLDSEKRTDFLAKAYFNDVLALTTTWH